MENATLQEKLIHEGWNLSSTGLSQITDNGKITELKSIIKRLLDIDLRAVSKGSLPEDINKTKYENIPGGIVLQIQKIKNLASPKYQEVHNNQNSSIIKIVLSDGVQNVQGVAMENIPSLHLNTMPGSKVFFHGPVEIAHCFLLLTLENTTFIGGRVEQLIDKWELNRKLAKHRRDNQEEGGPPPWIPFGQKIVKHIVADKNFKSLDSGKSKENSENSEFEAQRKGAILEASKIGAPKVFGGGNNKLLDHNVQVIVDAGFTIEQAEYALKLAKNNTDRALRSLQQKNSKSTKDDAAKGKAGEEKERGGKGGKGRGRHRDEEGASSLKPSAKVSLFDFLEDKLPATEKEAPTPIVDIRNSYDRKIGKPGKFSGDKFGYSDPMRGSAKREENDRSFRRNENYGGKYEAERSDRKLQERNSQNIRFDNKKTHYDQQRNDKSFGNFKVKIEFSGKTETARLGHRWNENWNFKQGTQAKPHKSEKSHDDENNRKSNFVPPTEKPPRFQKIANQQSDAVPHWADPRLPQTSDFQLQNSLANLTLQQNVANFSHTPQEHITVPASVPKNMFYQNVGVAVSGTTDVHRVPPPTVAAPPVAPPFQRRSPAATAYIAQDMKPTAFPGMPNVPDYPYKSNGFNDFQAVFGNAPRAGNNNYNSQTHSFNNSHANFNAPTANYNNTVPSAYSNAPSTGYTTGNTYNQQTGPANSYNSFTPQFLSTQQLMQPPPPTPQQTANSVPSRRWSWKKGQKCYARYWEDQNYYEALVTGVSENTCVVHFTEYGNYEEVLHDDCLPLNGISPET